MSKKNAQGRSHLKLIKGKNAKRINIYQAQGSALTAKARKFSPEEPTEPAKVSNRAWLRDWSPFFATLILTAVVWFFVGYYLVKIATIGG